MYRALIARGIDMLTPSEMLAVMKAFESAIPMFSGGDAQKRLEATLRRQGYRREALLHL
jgi:hypothetical protein